MWLTDLADACRSSGLEVVEVDGWRSRGHGELRAVEGIVAHHTATARTAQGDYPSLGVVRDGRSGLAGPLSQLGLGRSGRVYVIAAGVSWHAGLTHLNRQNNYATVGIEAEHPGGREPWPAHQYEAYVRLCAALAAWYRIPVAHIEGHREVAKPSGRKVDPTFNLATFRADIAEAMKKKPKKSKVSAVAKARKSLRDARKRLLAAAEYARKNGGAERARDLAAEAERLRKLLVRLPRR